MTNEQINGLYEQLKTQPIAAIQAGYKDASVKVGMSFLAKVAQQHDLPAFQALLTEGEMPTVTLSKEEMEHARGGLWAWVQAIVDAYNAGVHQATSPGNGTGLTCQAN